MTGPAPAALAVIAALAASAAGAGHGGQAVGRSGGPVPQDVATAPAALADTSVPFVVVLGIAQDGGVPQAGGPDRGIERLVVSLAVVDPQSDQRWLFEATPDFRVQLRFLDSVAPTEYPAPGLAGYDNIDVQVQEPGATVRLNERLSVTSFRVPHREEYGEVVGYRIDGPNQRVLFIPDIDGWDDWDSAGVHLEAQLALVDVAYVDGSFFDDGEIPGRDMSGFPHPRIRGTMDRLQTLTDGERAKIRFIHLNHTNPTLDPDGDARREVERRGFHVADEGEQLPL
jgi:pyrroloquinoline quinone biosynthesis protein B